MAHRAKKVVNPVEGELVLLKDDGEDLPWIIKDFLPWGCEGRHAWVIQNTRDGKKRIAFRKDIVRIEE